MHLRRDALAAAVRWTSLVERTARATPGVVATVGALHVHPGAANVVPGEAKATLDIRHADDAVRRSVTRLLRAAAEKIGARRNVAVAWRQQLDQPSAACDARLTALLARAVERSSSPVQRMTSGAGHDGMILSKIAPIAMLFVRSPGGISHHPDEAVRAGDVDAALAAGVAFLEELERSHV
jgi:allantoate deiminase